MKRLTVASILYLVTCYLLVIDVAAAEEVKAFCRELYDTATIDLEPGEKADLTVYLKSSGDPVDGFILQLFKLPLKAGVSPIQELKSDRYGIVVFKGLTPGAYHFQFKPSDKPLLTTDIGDMRFKKSYR